MPEVLKPDQRAVARRRMSGGVRLVLAGLLVALLFFVGADPNAVVEAIDGYWRHLLAALGLGQVASAGPPAVSGLLTKRSLVTVALYSLFYLSICLALLALALNSRARLRQALQLYGAVAVACGLLVVVGRLAGGAAWAYTLARHLIDFLVSPLPVIILIPLLRWQARPESVASQVPPGAL